VVVLDVIKVLTVVVEYITEFLAVVV
jgi:hypothetical protein